MNNVINAIMLCSRGPTYHTGDVKILPDSCHSNCYVFDVGSKSPGLRIVEDWLIGGRFSLRKFLDLRICPQSFSCVQLFATLWTVITRLPCLSPSPEVCSNLCLLSQWCHPTISSSVIPFSSCPQSFPASGSFPMSQLFPLGGQSTGTSAPALVFPQISRVDSL